MSGIWLTVALAVTRGENISVPQRDWPFLEWVQATPSASDDGLPGRRWCSRWRSSSAAHALSALHVRHRRGEEAAHASGYRSGGGASRSSPSPVGAAATGAGALFSARLLGVVRSLGIASCYCDRGRSRGRDGAHRRDRRHRADGTRRPGHDPDGHGMSILASIPSCSKWSPRHVIAAVVATMDRSRLFVTK